MKRLIFLTIFFLILGAFCLYTEIGTRNFIKRLPQLLQSTERTEANKSSMMDQEPNGVDAPNTFEPASTAELSEQKIPNAGKLQKPKPTFDWRNDEERPSKNKQIDPFGDYISEQQAKERGTWIGDPETMNPDELYDAEYKQLLERFGDIPQVHIHMEHIQKFKSDVPMTLDEEIAGLEATQYLFPSGRTSRTIAYKKWLQTKGDRGFNLEPGDLDYLRSLGIKVTIKETDEGTQISITTR